VDAAVLVGELQRRPEAHDCLTTFSLATST